MALIKWSTSLSVNVGEMDGQHQKLIEIINHLHDSISSGKGNEGPKLQIDELVDYTRKHFAAEEQLMQKYRYPLLTVHKAEHTKFTNEVDELRKRIVSGQPVSAYEMLQLLRSWLVAHIQGSDARYGKHISQMLKKLSERAESPVQE